MGTKLWAVGYKTKKRAKKEMPSKEDNVKERVTVFDDVEDAKSFLSHVAKSRVYEEHGEGIDIWEL